MSEKRGYRSVLVDIATKITSNLQLGLESWGGLQPDQGFHRARYLDLRYFGFFEGIVPQKPERTGLGLAAIALGACATPVAAPSPAIVEQQPDVVTGEVEIILTPLAIKVPTLIPPEQVQELTIGEPINPSAENYVVSKLAPVGGKVVELTHGDNAGRYAYGYFDENDNFIPIAVWNNVGWVDVDPKSGQITGTYTKLRRVLENGVNVRSSKDETLSLKTIETMYPGGSLIAPLGPPDENGWIEVLNPNGTSEPAYIKVKHKGIPLVTDELDDAIREKDRTPYEKAHFFATEPTDDYSTEGTRPTLEFTDFVISNGIFLPLGGTDGFTMEEAEFMRKLLDDSMKIEVFRDTVNQANLSFIALLDLDPYNNNAFAIPTNYGERSRGSANTWGMLIDPDHFRDGNSPASYKNGKGYIVGAIIHEAHRIQQEQKTKNGWYDENAVFELDEPAIVELIDYYIENNDPTNAQSAQMCLDILKKYMEEYLRNSN